MTGERDDDPGHRPHSRTPDYQLARIGAATGLTLTLILLLLYDAISPDYDISPTALGVLSTMILILLGIEGASFFRGGRD